MVIDRKRTATCNVDGVRIGGSSPVAVQSMTNTDTADTAATVNQVLALAQAGSELVRVTVNHGQGSSRGARDRQHIARLRLQRADHRRLPLQRPPAAAQSPRLRRGLGQVRINPGNVDVGKKHDDNFRTMIETAIEHNKPVRIGVNWGSLDQRLLTDQMDENARRTNPWSAAEVMYETIVLSAIRSAEAAEGYGLGHDRIILSAKVSNVQDLVAVYRALAKRCDYPLHLGLTEAGMGSKGVIASTAAIALLLQEGIGDTIRVSLTPQPDGDRCEEVEVAKQILQSMDIRHFTPQVTACPGCGRTTSTFFQEMADEIQTYLRAQMPGWRNRYEGVETMSVAVMGCVVNGPGESKHADIGISLPGTFEAPVAPVYMDGRLHRTLRGDRIVAEFIDILNAYVDERYRPKSAALAQ